nr:CapA family protein [uncultured Moraxella sp.]
MRALSILSLGALGLLACDSGLSQTSANSDMNLTTISPNNDNSSQTTKKPLVNVVAVGDVMMGSNFPNVGFLPPNDGKDSFAHVLPYLKGDVVFGNLEGTITDDGISTKCPPEPKPTVTPPVSQTDKTDNVAKTSEKPRTCYAFRMPVRYAKTIKDAGFNVMSIANNHVGDFGDVGRKSTMTALDNVGIHYAGLLTKQTTIFEKDGIRYGFVAFAPNVGTVNINDLDNAKKLVKALDKKVDIVIVSFHGGAEGAEHVRVPKTTEIYLNEKRGDVYAFSHGVIDVGADVVIGHGPHVTRGVELYKNRFIAYSLGNFNTYGAFNVRGLKGIAPILNLTLTNTGEFLTADVTSTKQSKDKGLELDPTHQAYNELKRLTALDFADTDLVFDSQKIVKK